MLIKQIIVTLCIFLALQEISGVVNNGPNTENSITVTNTTNDLSDNGTSSTNVSSVPDSVAESSDTVRRDTPLGLINTYGSPLLDNSYAPLEITNSLSLPVPIYGVPDVPSNNVIYPAPPPDIPPLVQNLPPKDGYGPPLPLPPPQFKYGSPQSKPFQFPKPIYGPPQFHKYGPPKPIFAPKYPKPIYGPPLKLYPQKPYFNLPKPFNPPKPLAAYGPPSGYPNLPPKPIYGPPKQFGPSLSAQYGPPDPVPQKPPPGVPAPPTPPEIKYDGWQPIPGLVSRPPSGHDNLHSNLDLVPPVEGFKEPPALSDSYGAPLNTVTGSGGVDSSSGDDHRSNNHELSVIHSAGFQLNPPKLNFGDSYGAPPLNSFSQNGPYPASQGGYKHNSLILPPVNNFANSIASSFDTTLLGGPHSFGGLIPPSGLYGVPPSGKYGTPLSHLPNRHHGPLFKQPKHPIAFRDPVPAGLIQSIGKAVAHKDAHGIINNVHHNYAGPAYVPPGVPDITDHKPPGPSSLYSLPNKNSISFQNYVQGSSSGGLNHGYNAPISSYGAPFGSVPQASTYYPNYDCSHKNNVFGLSPSQLSSLNSNLLGGGYPGPPPPFKHGHDLQISHSQHNGIVAGPNSNYLQQEVNAKALGESFAPGGELIQSQSVDFNNIPLQGSLGSYTLQIQSADGGGPQLNHNQVLHDGLLQSILNAIEQPKENGAAILGHPLIQLAPEQAQFEQGLVEGDHLGQTSLKNFILSPPPLENETKTAIDEVAVPQIDNNEVAIYFNRTAESGDSGSSVQPDDVRNGQQYGSYVSFKSEHGSFEYGDLPPLNQPANSTVSEEKLVQSET